MDEQEKKINEVLNNTDNEILDLNNSLNLLALPIIKYIYDKFRHHETNQIDPMVIINKIDEAKNKAEKTNQIKLNKIDKVINNGIKDLIYINNKNRELLNINNKNKNEYNNNFDVSINYEVAKFKRVVINLYNKLTDAMYHKFGIDLQQDILNAISQVSKGYETYDKAIKDIVKNLIINGTNKITHVTKTGKVINYSVYTVVRRNIVTSINQLATTINKLTADDLNTDLVEVSAHAGSRPSHQNWQGKIYTLSLNNNKYPHISNTGYGAVDGLAGVNCRHTFFPFVEGVSKPTYTNKELSDLKKSEGKILIHKEVIRVPLYEATQTQRKIERTIRQKKEIAQAYLKIYGKDSPEYKKAKKQVEEWNKQYSILCNLNGFYKESARLGNYIKWK